MSFYADLHIHSKYSRATSRDCDLENLTYWGRKKGMTVIGTGDFTHPAWFQEIQEKLIPAEPGLFRLKPDLDKKISEKLPRACQGSTRFMLSVEISTIYKKGGKVRKIHHLIYAPSFEKAAKINKSLEKIGNIRSDGRPILGLDSRHLLEIVLQAGVDCYLVPAHIWTPWFAVLGSKSGFDDVADCYADLASHVFAVETGLSSDPEMNWKISSLDRYRLMSNSDAHSPPKLGREVNVFHTELDYYSMWRALQTGKGFGGTLEFFPEEGKYHLDGHRHCGVRFSPEESKAHRGICPKCQKPLTLGVLYRVEELADRQPHQKPEGAADFKSIIPLPEVISEIMQVGPASQDVCKTYDNLVSKLGAELDILNQHPLEDIQRASSSLMKEAIERMREGNVIREAGYDGEYGRIKLFEEKELQQRGSMGVLFEMEIDASTVPIRRGAIHRAQNLYAPNKAPGAINGAPTPEKALMCSPAPCPMPHAPRSLPHAFSLDPSQALALEIIQGPLLIVAGPGSGKTRTLTHRIAHLIKDGHAKPEECLAITFTRRAAQEMKERLQKLLPVAWQKIPVMTFHALGLQILEENRVAAGLPRGFRVASEEEKIALLKEKLKISEAKAEKWLREVSAVKRRGAINGAPPVENVFQILHEARETQGWLDYDDLVLESLRVLEADPGLCAVYRERFRFISMDEYQDIDEFQYRFIRRLVPPDGNLCAIGDPDQSIYSFRGASLDYFLRFKTDFPSAGEIQLTRNYRSGESIIAASNQLIAPSALVADRKMEALLEDTGKIVIHHSPTAKAEAEFVVHTMEQMVGGTSFFSLDTKRTDGILDRNYGFADFAVLFRTGAQATLIEEALERSGIPYQKHGHSLEELENWDSRADRVSLLTLHAAKGLEFPVVFITGCEEGLLPLYWKRVKKGTGHFSGPGRESDPSPFSLAEERRLFYVGMTRAKDRLFLSAARKRMMQGKIHEREDSRFLKDIEEELLERRASSFKTKSRTLQKELF